MAAVFLCMAPAGLVHGKASEEGEQSEDPVDYVALAARLIKDGHYDRAEATLQQVDPNREGLDVARYHTLRGMVFMQKQAYSAARDAFTDALRQGEPDGTLFLSLAQACFSLKDYEAALHALKKAGQAARSEPAAFLMEAESHWKLEQPEQAIAALERGSKRFPEESRLGRRKIFYFIDLGLYQAATELGQAYLARKGVSPDDYVAIGQALRGAKQYGKAQVVLEAARLEFPENVEIALQLAHSYLEDEQPLAAATVMEDAARLEPEHTVEAAELYSQAGRHELALMLNARVLDRKAKARQRLSLLLEMERYDMIAAMDHRLSRLGLLAKDEVRYALAYAHFKLRDFDAAERHLKQITDAQLFVNANQLRQAIERCEEQGWECI